MRTSQALTSVLERVRAAGLAAEAELIETEALRVRGIEAMLDAVLEGLDEPICFPARRVPGLRAFAAVFAQAAD
ncbi:MAG: hypothetical protein NT133_03595 [Alphaproteobacteria bacterium]|nr:hypothetical protein [Alphaproteobacteria bacterium]